MLPQFVFYLEVSVRKKKRNKQLGHIKIGQVVFHIFLPRRIQRRVAGQKSVLC
jgi:hypothetical protein